jgi:ectoine hydroxylase-related dioxygenase (phytanoyl-CoA dioxygenase family)
MELPMLPEDKVRFFREQGFLLVEDVVSPELLRRLKADFSAWIDESRGQKAPYGTSLDGRPRFDLEAGHSAERPALRRVASPIEVSEAYLEAVRAPDLVNAVAALIGPNIKFHHSKINSKLPGTATSVKWHQDFAFTPHSNDDLITALLMIDDVTEENGPLEIWPGTHRGPIHDLWRGDRFAGAVDEEFARTCQANAVRCVGPAGAVCLMHTRLLHGSAPNLSAHPRTLFIAVYSAEDARPLGDNPLPSRFEGMLVHGVATGRARSTPFDIRLPPKPKGASFFSQQALTDET